MPESIKMYPDDIITDSPEYFLISEFIREKVLLLTSEEIPHSVSVVIDKIEKEDNYKKHIMATIVVERKSQKRNYNRKTRKFNKKNR